MSGGAFIDDGRYGGGLTNRRRLGSNGGEALAKCCRCGVMRAKVGMSVVRTANGSEHACRSCPEREA
jgi:hypothetical protein